MKLTFLIIFGLTLSSLSHAEGPQPGPGVSSGMPASEILLSKTKIRVVLDAIPNDPNDSIESVQLDPNGRKTYFVKIKNGTECREEQYAIERIRARRSAPVTVTFGAKFLDSRQVDCN